MVHAAPEEPPRLAHYEILEEKQTQLDHVENVLPKCHCIMEISQTCIDRGIFSGRYDVRYVLDAIMTEARGA